MGLWAFPYSLPHFLRSATDLRTFCGYFDAITLLGTYILLCIRILMNRIVLNVYSDMPFDYENFHVLTILKNLVCIARYCILEIKMIGLDKFIY